MMDVLDFLGWCFIPMLVCSGGLVAVVIGQIPLFSEKYPVLTGWQSRVYACCYLFNFRQPFGSWLLALS